MAALTRREVLEEFRHTEEYRRNAAGFKHDITKDELKDHYNELGEGGLYETYLSLDRYKAPIIVADIINQYLGPRHKSDKILDCAAGTGYVGEMLTKEGFNNLYALEPSSGMAEVARRKNVYQTIHEDFIEEFRSPFDENSFDALVCVGSFGAGHIPTRALNEMAKIVKPRGHIFISYREEYADECTDLEPYMQDLEKAGKWVMKSRVVYPGHFFDLNGVCAIFEVLRP